MSDEMKQQSRCVIRKAVGTFLVGIGESILHGSNTDFNSTDEDVNVSATNSGTHTAVSPQYKKQETKQNKTLSKVNIVVITDVGKCRTNNEDNYMVGNVTNDSQTSYGKHQFQYLLASEDDWFACAVFDGMGGEENGEIASGLAAQNFSSMLGQKTCAHVRFLADVVDLIADNAFTQAGRAIGEFRGNGPVLGTTAVLCCANMRRCRIRSIGDSRAYLWRDNRLEPLTEDQTMGAMNLRLGLYTADDSRYLADSRKLTDYLGRVYPGDQVIAQKTDWLEWKTGDTILMCSDGLCDMVSDAEIAELLREDQSLSDAAAALVDLANLHGGEDNVTCMLISLSDGGTPTESADEQELPMMANRHYM